MALKFWCNKCGSLLESKSNSPGVVVTCYRCGNDMQAPPVAINLDRSSAKRNTKETYQEGSKAAKIQKKFKRYHVILGLFFSVIVDNVIRHFYGRHILLIILAYILGFLAVYCLSQFQRQAIESIPESQRNSIDYSNDVAETSKDKGKIWQRMANSRSLQRKKYRDQ